MPKGVREAGSLCPHGAQAKPFQTSHLCWQDRIGKEVGRQMTGAGIAVNHVPAVVLDAAPREFYGMGTRHGLNNRSSQISTALGPRIPPGGPTQEGRRRTWEASGGLKTQYSLASGRRRHERSMPDLPGARAVQEAAARFKDDLSAATNQRAAVKYRSVDELLRIGRMDASELAAAKRAGAGTIVALAVGMRGGGGGGGDAQGAVARHQDDLGAAAHQREAVRWRSEGEMLRIAKMSSSEVEAAKRQGAGTIVALAKAMRGGGAQGVPSAAAREALGVKRQGLAPSSLGRATLIALPM